MLAFLRALPQMFSAPAYRGSRMIDFAAARRMMVDGQVRTADVTDQRILAAMQDLPRERFFPDDKASLAYLDLDVAVSAAGQPVRRLLKPMVLAKLIQAAAIAPADRVLDIGCATGYGTALLTHLAGAVIGLDEDAGLARQAAAALGAGIADARIETGPLSRGCPADGPFDVIVLEGAVEFVPPALFDQLKDGGRLVCVLSRGADGKAMLYRRIDGDLSGRAVFDAAAAPLPGFAKPAAFVF
jgi:protein-L-isoaspartate(D-aspartate) O-methyltransferase